jgi:hypothetical protein
MADFQHHASPVLALAVIDGSTSSLSVPPHSMMYRSGTQLAFSGCTSGEVAVWDLSTFRGGSQTCQNRQHIRGDAAAVVGPAANAELRPSLGGTARGRTVKLEGLPSVAPLLAMEGAHQSGVNALSAYFDGTSSMTYHHISPSRA